MTLNDVARTVAPSIGMSIVDTEKALRAGLEEIGNAVLEGNKITVANFGTFKAQDRDAYTARDPRTGTPVDVPARRKVAFKASDNLRT